MSEQRGQRVRASRDKKKHEPGESRPDHWPGCRLPGQRPISLLGASGKDHARGLACLGTFLTDRGNADQLIARLAERQKKSSTTRAKTAGGSQFLLHGPGQERPKNLDPFYSELSPESARDKKLALRPRKRGVHRCHLRPGEADPRTQRAVLGQSDNAHYNSVAPRCVS